MTVAVPSHPDTEAVSIFLYKGADSTTRIRPSGLKELGAVLSAILLKAKSEAEAESMQQVCIKAATEGIKLIESREQTW